MRYFITFFILCLHNCNCGNSYSLCNVALQHLQQLQLHSNCNCKPVELAMISVWRSFSLWMDNWPCDSFAAFGHNTEISFCTVERAENRFLCQCWITAERIRKAALVWSDGLGDTLNSAQSGNFKNTCSKC